MVLRKAKALVERTFGIKITRSRSSASQTRKVVSKHFYPDLVNFRQWKSSDVIFDVGANDGRTILALQEVLPPTRIYAFEPASSTYAKLVERTAAMPNVQPFNIALGAKSGVGVLHLSSEATNNSLSATWREAEATEEVVLSTVDAFMEDQNVDFVHFLKIDAEGHDLEVLKGAEEALQAAKIGIIQAELRYDKPGLDLEAFRTYLEPKGYHLYGLYNQAREKAKPPESWPSERAAEFAPRVLSYTDAIFVAAQVEPVESESFATAGYQEARTAGGSDL